MTMRCEQLLDALNQKEEQKETQTPAIVDTGVTGKWTILIYLDADNNLEGAGVGDVQEMLTRAATANGGFGNNKV
jgi:cation transport regulator ChaC